MLFICGGLMRTGSVAMYQIMRELVLTKDIGYAPLMPLNEEDKFFRDNVNWWARDEMNIVVKLHRWREELADHKGNFRVVMTVRDLRDVVVSLMNFRQGTFESSLHSAALAGNIDGQAEWEREVPLGHLYKVFYEDFMVNRARTTEAVAGMIGIELNAYESSTIERKWNIPSNLKRAAHGYSEASPDYMSKRHIQSGKVGQWKKALTPEQIVAVQDKVGHQWFEDNGYELWQG